MSTRVPQELQECIRAVQNQSDADLYLYSADVDADNADELIDLIFAKEERRNNAILILATYGGDPDAAYRMARALKRFYGKFILLVFGYCKSAGTLIAIGADEIIMSDFAELGPIDVQILKEDEFKRSSGLDLQQSINVLGEGMYALFEKFFIETIYRSDGVISTQMATKVATDMAVGLLSPITSQIDPLKLGEQSRSIHVAFAYGVRLNPERANSVRSLVEDYPSHSFVIDREEARDLFQNVREPTPHELVLEAILRQCVRSPTPQKLIYSLDSFLDEDDEEEVEEEVEATGEGEEAASEHQELSHESSETSSENNSESGKNGSVNPALRTEA
jgi:hypothetical protein